MGSVGWLAGKAQIKRARAKSKPSPAKHTESTATTNAKFHDYIHFEGLYVYMYVHVFLTHICRLLSASWNYKLYLGPAVYWYMYAKSD